jgi:hypothetical protein
VFNPRCPYEEPICHTDIPADVMIGERMAACHFAVRRQHPELQPLDELSGGLPG